MKKLLKHFFKYFNLIFGQVIKGYLVRHFYVHKGMPQHICLLCHKAYNEDHSCALSKNQDQEVHTIVIVYFIQSLSMLKDIAKYDKEDLLICLEDYFQYKFENKVFPKRPNNPFFSLNTFESYPAMQTFTAFVKKRNSTKCIIELYLPYDIKYLNYEEIISYVNSLSFD